MTKNLPEQQESNQKNDSPRLPLPQDTSQAWENYKKSPSINPGLVFDHFSRYYTDKEDDKKNRGASNIPWS